MKHAQLVWFRQQQQQVLDAILPDYRGYELLLLGHDDLLPVQPSPVQHCFSVVGQGLPKVAMVADYQNLPLANQFVDVVVAWHVFDTHPEPKVLLQEIQRVLRHDGVLIVLGAHRPRLAARAISQSEQYRNQTGTLNTLVSLRLAAYDAGMQVDQLRYFAGVRHQKDQGIRRSLDQFVCRALPCLALGYCVVFTQQMAGLTPLKEKWAKEKVALNKQQVPTTCQRKDRTYKL